MLKHNRALLQQVFKNFFLLIGICNVLTLYQNIFIDILLDLKVLLEKVNILEFNFQVSFNEELYNLNLAFLAGASKSVFNYAF